MLNYKRWISALILLSLINWMPVLVVFFKLSIDPDILGLLLMFYFLSIIIGIANIIITSIFIIKKRVAVMASGLILIINVIYLVWGVRYYSALFFLV